MQLLDSVPDFLDLERLKSAYLKDKDVFNKDFEYCIVIGIGGSSQGSKAINSFLNEEKVIYFDHLNYHLINKTLNSLDLKKTGFIFVSKSGLTSEILTLFDYLSGELENKINISKHFYTITEIKSSPLHDLSTQKSIPIIKHDEDIAGRFSIFSNASLLPGFIYNEKMVDNFFKGAKLGVEKEIMAQNRAISKQAYIDKGLSINAMLIYGDQLIELGNWLKQLYAESLGKNNRGYLPVVSPMPKDQHSLMQLYIDGPKNTFFEIISMKYKQNNFINVTLTNHKEAMYSTIESKSLPFLGIEELEEDKILELGSFLSNRMLEVVHHAKIIDVDPFNQDAVEAQKNFLK